jgi:hypothetical protein
MSFDVLPRVLNSCRVQSCLPMASVHNFLVRNLTLLLLFLFRLDILHVEAKFRCRIQK